MFNIDQRNDFYFKIYKNIILKLKIKTNVTLKGALRVKIYVGKHKIKYLMITELCQLYNK